MRIAIASANGAGAELAQCLARSGHEVDLTPTLNAGPAAAEVVVLAAPASKAEEAIEAAGRRMGPDSFVVALVHDAAPGAQPRATLGDPSRGASARVVRLALALQEAGILAEVSLDIHAAIARLRSPQAESAGGEGSDACRRC